MGTGAGRAVFLSRVPPSVRSDLWGAPLDGSAPAVRLHPPLAEGYVAAYEVAAAAGRVVYVVDSGLDV